MTGSCDVIARVATLDIGLLVIGKTFQRAPT